MSGASGGQIDIDAYIDALPSHRLREPRTPPSSYHVSRWPLLKPYNGFTGIERRRGGQLAIWLLAAGCISRPKRCDICGCRDRVGLHGEVYYDVLRDPALCQRCHRALHRRHFEWDKWRCHIDAASTSGREWFALAPRYGIDIAQHLRDRWGWHAADVERSPISPLPEAIKTRLPKNMLPHPFLERPSSL